MKNLLFITAALLLAGGRLGAQTFGLDWFSLDAGGGVSAGGSFSLVGTIGQPDAGVVAGGNFTLYGGFLVPEVAAPPGPAPTLTVQRAAGHQVFISWAATADTWQLEQNPTLDPATWTNVGPQPNLVNGQEQIVLPAAGQGLFYRLKKM